MTFRRPSSVLIRLQASTPSQTGMSIWSAEIYIGPREGGAYDDQRGQHLQISLQQQITGSSRDNTYKKIQDHAPPTQRQLLLHLKSEKRLAGVSEAALQAVAEQQDYLVKKSAFNVHA